MIAIDTNVLVAAHRRDATWHNAARNAVSRLAEGPVPWAIPWPCVHEFLAIATHPRIFDPPSTLEQATGQVEAWIQAPTLELIGETPSHWPTLHALLRAGRVLGPRVHDARVAAICVAHGVSELWSADRDFSRFPTLVVRNPLVETPPAASGV